MKTPIKILKQIQKEALRKEQMSVKSFFSHFALYTSEEVDFHFLEDNIESYITYFFSNN